MPIDAPTHLAPAATDFPPAATDDTPDATDRAPARAPGRIRSATLRVAVGTLALSTLASVGIASDPPAVVAGGSCTGWASKVVPPRTIKVLRTRSGRVEKVRFRRYVAEVMASGEWPGRLHMTTLEAGAVATKQYAWYHALKGHHRSGYRRNGRCYDVRDDTMDQLFRPERARPTKRQLRAIGATWGLTLRKNGQFFLTGYRAGTAQRCAADANGWKLYARSVQACARKGWSRQRVQRAYLSPNLSFVWAERIGPAMRRPRVSLHVGNRLPWNAATVRWRMRSGKAPIRKYVVERRVGRGSWRRIDLASPGARRADVWVKPGSRVRFRARAIDEKGRRGHWASSHGQKAVIAGRTGRVLTDVVSASGVRPQVRVALRARSIALIARKGPGLGTARIFVNGRHVADVDLSSDTPTARSLVWARNFDRVYPRSLRVVSAAGRVELEGFLALR